MAIDGEDADSTLLEEEDDHQHDRRFRNGLADHILQSLLLNYGLIEDWEARIIEDLGSQNLNESGLGAATLRQMRRAGNFGQLDETAQTTLLGGTLFEYSAAAPPTRAVDAQQAIAADALSNTDGSHATVGRHQTEAFTSLRQDVERILHANTIGNSSGLDDSLMSTGALSSTGGIGLDSTVGVLEGHLASAVVAPLQAPASPNHTLERGINETMSVLGASQLDENGRSMRDAVAWSPASTFDGARTNYFGSGAFGDLDGTGLLLNLLNGAEFDQSLARSVRRVMQMGTVLAEGRAGLSDQEIQALPKVRFHQTEEQQCAICLEQFQSGELLTQLRCLHFFHVSCVTRWFEQSTQCPLCRSNCGQTS